MNVLQKGCWMTEELSSLYSIDSSDQDRRWSEELLKCLECCGEEAFTQMGCDGVEPWCHQKGCHRV